MLVDLRQAGYRGPGIGGRTYLRLGSNASVLYLKHICCQDGTLLRIVALYGEELCCQDIFIDIP